MQSYSFYHCTYDAGFVFIETQDMAMVEAMRHAVELAFKQGQQGGSLRGLFICVRDPKGQEVFRTPLAKY